MKQETCFKCNVRFAMSDATYDYALSTGEVFYCPNGHGQHYTKTESKQTREIKELRKSNVTLNEVISYQGKTIRKLYDEVYYLKRDQCQHCKKWYINLDDHIKKQHSDEG